MRALRGLRRNSSKPASLYSHERGENAERFAQRPLHDETARAKGEIKLC